MSAKKQSRASSLWIADVDNDKNQLFALTMTNRSNCRLHEKHFPLDSSHPKQQGLKLKTVIHHLMAGTEWVLSDDWKLWRNAHWGSYMNPFRVLRSVAFNTMHREKLFALFESFSCCFCYLHLWCGDCNQRSTEQANWKLVYLLCFFPFLSWENVCCFVYSIFKACS